MNSASPEKNSSVFGFITDANNVSRLVLADMDNRLDVGPLELSRKSSEFAISVDTDQQFLTQTLQFCWPSAPAAPFWEDFFFGAWLPRGNLKVEFNGAPPSQVDPVVIKGDQFVFVSNSSKFHHPKTGLVHRSIDTNNQVTLAFRGYILNAPIHSWSYSQQILDYWKRNAQIQHNGVFAAAIASFDRLELLTDAFGIAPLYYRELWNGVVLFSTAPRYLRTADDDNVLDSTAVRMIFHHGALAGDLSLVPDVLRVPPGTRIRFTVSGKMQAAWFEFGSLPKNGTSSITSDHLEIVERSFQTAIDRCLALMPDVEHQLPLSSGYDSRRILAGLYARHAPFKATTVRVFQKGHDLDARFAGELASRFGFPHSVVDLPDFDQSTLDDRSMRTLFSAEVLEHEWMGSLYRGLSQAPSLVFDGLAGDALEETGFEKAELHTMPAHAKRTVVSKLVLPDAAPLREHVLVSIQQARETLLGQIDLFPEGNNWADYVFLTTRCRRETGAAAQCLAPAGYITVYPYLDLDYVQVSMTFSPSEKLPPKSIGSRCLREFWPDFFSVPGTRNVPASVLQEPIFVGGQFSDAQFVNLEKECSSQAVLEGCLEWLRPEQAFLALASRCSSNLRKRCRWWLKTFLVIISYRRNECRPWSICPPRA